MQSTAYFFVGLTWTFRELLHVFHKMFEWLLKLYENEYVFNENIDEVGTNIYVFMLSVLFLCFYCLREKKKIDVYDHINAASCVCSGCLMHFSTLRY